MTLAEQFRQEGRQEDRQAGLLNGIKQGEQKGRMEAIKSVATRLFNQGLSVSQIDAATDLSTEEVEKLKNSLTH